MLHPEDRPDPAAETGPWSAFVLAGTIAWIALAALESRYLAAGTSPWALVRSASTLVIAPAVAAVLLQDARVRAATVGGIGAVRWLYALVALVFPPGSIAYLLHQYSRRE
jgi:apolipoprotein N-acyltransferase